MSNIVTRINKDGPEIEPEIHDPLKSQEQEDEFRPVSLKKCVVNAHNEIKWRIPKNHNHTFFYQKQKKKLKFKSRLACHLCKEDGNNCSHRGRSFNSIYKLTWHVLRRHKSDTPTKIIEKLFVIYEKIALALELGIPLSKIPEVKEFGIWVK